MEKLGTWYIGFGVFLVACGIAGFASNPAEAKTALITGSVFGVAAALLGWGMQRRIRWAPLLALLLTLLLLAAFSWRATVGWLAVGAGEPKLFAASLISVMWVATVLSVAQWFRLGGALKKLSSETPDPPR